MADSSEQQGPASYVTRQLADSSDRIGDWLEKREPTQVMDEVAGYARRHPVAFMGIAAGLGLLVGRVVRGAKDADSGGDSAADHGSGSPGAGGDDTRVEQPCPPGPARSRRSSPRHDDDHG